jgi:hypothetical protein
MGRARLIRSPETCRSNGGREEVSGAWPSDEELWRKSLASFCFACAAADWAHLSPLHHKICPAARNTQRKIVAPEADARPVLLPRGKGPLLPAKRPGRRCRSLARPTLLRSPPLTRPPSLTLPRFVHAASGGSQCQLMCVLSSVRSLSILG